jgi:hypothetical protein
MHELDYAWTRGDDPRHHDSVPRITRIELREVQHEFFDVSKKTSTWFAQTPLRRLSGTSMSGSPGSVTR